MTITVVNAMPPDQPQLGDWFRDRTFSGSDFRPDAELDSIEEQIQRLRAPELRVHIDQIPKTAPTQVQDLARGWPPWQLYRVVKGAPYPHAVPGSIVVPAAIMTQHSGFALYFLVLRSPIGHAGVVLPISEDHLVPIALDELRRMISSTN
jgi:hypothetical protein